MLLLLDEPRWIAARGNMLPVRAGKAKRNSPEINLHLTEFASLL
jgi:hypothetical protein